MKTAPFDLELAKLGHPLITRGGDKIQEFDCFNAGIAGWLPIRALTNTMQPKVFSYNAEGCISSTHSSPADLLLDLETPWERPLQQGDKIMVFSEVSGWLPTLFVCFEGAQVVVKGLITAFYGSYTQWKRPEPVVPTSKIDITLDVRVNGKYISEKDKNKFMDYLKKFVNEVL